MSTPAYLLAMAISGMGLLRTSEAFRLQVPQPPPLRPGRWRGLRVARIVGEQAPRGQEGIGSGGLPRLPILLGDVLSAAADTEESLRRSLGSFGGGSVVENDGYAENMPGLFGRVRLLSHLFYSIEGVGPALGLTLLASLCQRPPLHRCGGMHGSFAWASAGGASCEPSPRPSRRSPAPSSW